jgi:hypothetical protein
VTSRTINRLTAGLSLAGFVGLSLLLAHFSVPQNTDTLLRRASTFFTDPSGARALFLVTRELFPRVEQWRRPLQFLPEPDEASTLFLAGPQRPLGFDEAEHLERWLANGGQLILLSADGWRMRPQPAAGEPDQSAPAPAGTAGERGSDSFLKRWEPSLKWTRAARDIRTATGSGESIGADGIVLGWHVGFRSTGNAKVIASAGAIPLAVETSVGRGRIVAIADPAMASNAALRRSDNSVWLLGLMAERSGTVLFDEYHHGFGQKRGSMELSRIFLATPWGWVLLQIAAAGLLYAFFCRRRFGRIREPLAVERSSPIELIAARAGIFRAAAAQRLAADLIVQHLCQSLVRARSRLVDANRLEQELDTALRRAGQEDDRGLRQQFARIRNGERLSDREFIDLGKAAGEIVEGTKP